MESSDQRSLTIDLMLLGDEFNPVFKATLDPMLRWLASEWNALYPVEDMHFVLQRAADRLRGVKRPWAHVSGPASAFVATLGRIGWSVVSPTVFRTHRGDNTQELGPRGVQAR